MLKINKKLILYLKLHLHILSRMAREWCFAFIYCLSLILICMPTAKLPSPWKPLA